MITSKGLRVDLDGKVILHGLDFNVRSGSWVGILGPNGAGKTTLLRAIGGLIPYKGQLLISDREVRDWNQKQLARRIAFVRQSVALSFDFKVKDLVILGRSPQKGWLAPFNTQDEFAVERALDSVDLIGFEDRPLHSLSTGEQRRVFLAQALVQDPEILLLDEPIAHLDIHHRFELLDHVGGFVANGQTVLTAFHDLSLASRYADTLLVMNKGRIAAFGKPPEVLTSSLIDDVFRVRADVVRDGEAVADVRLLGKSMD